MNDTLKQQLNILMSPFEVSVAELMDGIGELTYNIGLDVKISVTRSETLDRNFGEVFYEKLLDKIAETGPVKALQTRLEERDKEIEELKNQLE